VSLVGVLVVFNAWNWFLGLTGVTTIEFWKMQSHQEGDEFYNYAFKTVKDNLFTIFGTHKIVRIFSPSLRSVPFNGIEWSFMLRDLGYDEQGEKLYFDAEHGKIVRSFEVTEREKKDDRFAYQVVEESTELISNPVSSTIPSTFQQVAQKTWQPQTQSNE